MTNIVFSPALQAPIALTNPTGGISVSSDPSLIITQANPIPTSAVISTVGAAVKLALGIAVGSSQATLAGVLGTVISGLVTKPNISAGSAIVTSSAPTVTLTNASNPLTFPRVMLVGYGGDQSYGCNAANSYPNWRTAAAGNAANSAIQILASYDIVLIAGIFEGWDTSGVRDRENLSQALLKNTTYPIKLNTARPTLSFYYHIQSEGETASSGGGYQQLINQIVAMNGWLYTAAHAGGSIAPAASGMSSINYATAWPGNIGSALIGQSIVGTNYGTTSVGSPTGAQGVARTNGNYAAVKLLIRNSSGIDTRFTFNAQMAAPSAAGVMLDNCFVALDGGGSVSSASLDGITIAPGSQQGGGFPGLDTVQPVLARGHHNFFDQMQVMVGTYGTPGKNYYNFANFGQYANKYQFGTATLTAGLENTLHGGLLESVLGQGVASWEVQFTGKTGGGTYASGWLNLLTNYYQGMDFCQSPKLVGLGTKLPAADGSTTSSWVVGAGQTLTTVTAGTALEYQLMRYGLCTTLMDDGYFAPGTSAYDWAKLRWYDEYGDDSLTQVNVPRGYLGAALSVRPSSPTWAQGTLGVWSRSFVNGIAIINPRGNGAQTITLGGTYTALLGTQQASINNGVNISSLTIPDGDGRILLGPLLFATNRPAGLNTIMDRQFDPGDVPAGAHGTDPYGMGWNIGNGPVPVINTPAQMSSTVGVTIPPLPDGHPTGLVVVYSAGLPAGQTPWFAGLNTFPVIKHMYIAQWVLMPSNFNSNGNNIKWLFFAGGDSRNHVAMLSSGQPGTYKGPWAALQGGGGNKSLGGGGANAGWTVNLSTPTFTNDGVWKCVEWEFILESNPGVSSDGIARGFIAGTKTFEYTNVRFNAPGDAPGFNEFNWEPFYGGGGSTAPAQECLCVGRMLVAGI